MAFVLGWGYLQPQGFIGLCCSDGVRDHFNLVRVRGCNAAVESMNGSATRELKERKKD